MLLLDARSVMQAAADLDLPPPRRDGFPRSISVQPVDAALLDAFVRVVKILGEPTTVPRLAPLILQEITIRLLMGVNTPVEECRKTPQTVVVNW
jgi:hypothetical protein